jgi:hypothetical protein
VTLIVPSGHGCGGPGGGGGGSADDVADVGLPPDCAGAETDDGGLVAEDEVVVLARGGMVIGGAALSDGLSDCTAPTSAAGVAADPVARLPPPSRAPTAQTSSNTANAEPAAAMTRRRR